jgi:ABC-type sugar transport system permease subunit
MASANEYLDRLRERNAGTGPVDYTPYYYLVPALLLYVLVVFYPLAKAVNMSFYEFTSFTGEKTWVGLANYETVLRDPIFWEAMFNTVIFSFGIVFIPLALGLIIAVTLDSKVPGWIMARTIAFVPVVVPIVVAGLLFTWLFGTNGIINSILVTTGLVSDKISFLGSSTLALPTVMTMAIWKRTGYYMVILLAGLQSIPDDMYEAARIQGKSSYRIFRHITVPLLKPAIMITLIIGLVDTIKLFAHVWVMTEGGPAHDTEIVSTYFYKTIFEFLNFGVAAAMGVIMFFIAMTLALIAFSIQGD